MVSKKVEGVRVSSIDKWLSGQFKACLFFFKKKDFSRIKTVTGLEVYALVQIVALVV